MIDGDRCHCGAARREGAEWCPRCLEPYEPKLPDDHDLAVFRFRPPELRTSRVAETPLSFGLLGRALLTAVIAFPAVYGWASIVIYFGTVRMMLDIIWVPVWTAVTLYFCRPLWAAVRVPPPQGVLPLDMGRPADDT